MNIGNVIAKSELAEGEDGRNHWIDQVKKEHRLLRNIRFSSSLETTQYLLFT
jgi:hypothetical protein